MSAGKLGDFVVLSGNPWENPEKINEITVELTIVGGEIVYQDSDTTLAFLSG
ncbi:MAG: hypothetical protein ACXAB4_10560 [Candidatus Hodarchaeales archaeon]